MWGARHDTYSYSRHTNYVYVCNILMMNASTARISTESTAVTFTLFLADTSTNEPLTQPKNTPPPFCTPLQQQRTSRQILKMHSIQILFKDLFCVAEDMLRASRTVALLAGYWRWHCWYDRSDDVTVKTRSRRRRA